MLKMWRKYPKRRPKYSGSYLCTIAGKNINYTKTLTYHVGPDEWIDESRQTVFDGYNVYKVCRATIEENRVYTDVLCDWTEKVIAWKELSKPCRK